MRNGLVCINWRRMLRSAWRNLYEARSITEDTSSLLLWIAAFAASFVLLALAMQAIPMSTAYAIWTGIGTVGTALTGMFLYREPREWRRVLFITMIICSATGLKLLYGSGL